MRVVTEALEFDGMLASCKREAAAGFGNDAVLVERYLARPRHVEIQVFADRQGNFVYLFERDCSVQRRHQKVVEEAPAPGMTAQRRRAMGEAAVAAARAVGYVGAGTVEFIVDAEGEFFFMEMNTRLQVEHPVTEMITGFDLVEWQLRVAAGEPLPVDQASLAIDGHAIEARIYAENPERGFLPSTGLLKHLVLPTAVQFQVAAGGAAGEAASVEGSAAAAVKARVRIDSGVRAGDEITPHYDPMIAKLIVWGEDRNTARRTLSQALAQLQVVGPATNVDFLRRLIVNPAFAAADLDTGLIERERASLLPPPEPASTADLVLAAAAVLGRETDGTDPWSVRGGWRLGAPLQRRLVFADDSGPREVMLTYGAGGCTARVGATAAPVSPGSERESLPSSGSEAPDSPAVFLPRPAAAQTRASAAASAPGAKLAPAPGSVVTGATQATRRRVTLQVGDKQHHADAVFDDETLHLFTASRHLRLQYIDRIAHAGEAAEEGGRLTAPMPGKVISVLVQPGSAVSRGDPLLVMEAMKMEHTITAPSDGIVALIHYGIGDQVIEGAALVAIEQQAVSPSA
jgi:3-methylcrotonyl-CoA carboxylase alpha subunit